MGREALRSRLRARAMHVAPRSTRARPNPGAVGHSKIAPEPTMCERCGAVFRNKTWRAGERTRRTSPIGVAWALCPACAQVQDEEYYGRVRILKPLDADRELEVRRRIWNVEERARYTQPERRTVRIDRNPSGLEILTTSQKLAHRIVRELEKAFGGRVHLVWADREDVLEATWDPPAPKPQTTVRTRRPRIKRRTLERTEKAPA